MEANMKLVRYEQARAALAICVEIDEAKEISDQAESLRAYARQYEDKELEQWAAEIKLRAQRRIGEISIGLEKAKCGGKDKSVLPPGGRTKAESLEAVGISVQLANRCEKLAAVPEAEFEEFIAEFKVKEKPASARAARKLLKRHEPPKPLRELLPAFEFEAIQKWLEQRRDCWPDAIRHNFVGFVRSILDLMDGKEAAS